MIYIKAEDFGKDLDLTQVVKPEFPSEEVEDNGPTPELLAEIMQDASLNLPILPFQPDHSVLVEEETK